MTTRRTPRRAGSFACWLLLRAAVPPQALFAQSRPDRPWSQSRPRGDWAPRTAKPLAADSVRERSALNAPLAGTQLSVSRIAYWIDDAARFVELPEVYELALETVLAVAGPSHPLLGYLHVRYARFLFQQAHPEPGRRYAAGDPRGPTAPRSALPGHPALGAATRRSRALSEAMRGEEILRAAVRLDLRHLTDEDARRVALGRESALDLILTLAASSANSAEIAQAWDAYLRSRAVVLDELAARQQAVATSGDSSLARLGQALDQARSRLEELSFAPLRDGDHPAAAIAETRAETARLEVAIARHSDAFRRRMQERTVGLPEVLARLGPGEALVAFAYYRDLTPRPDESGVPAWRQSQMASQDSLRVLAFVLAPGSNAPRLLPLGPARSLDALADRWRVLVSQGSTRQHDPALDQAANAAGDTLRRRLWDPIEPWVRAARRVYVVMDGALQLVNLAALPSGDADRSYVIERAPAFAYLGTERDLAREPSPATGRGLLAMGGVDFGGSRASSGVRAAENRPGEDCEGWRRLAFPELQATEYEVQAVAVHWRAAAGDSARQDDCLTFMGAAASESTFRACSRGRRALHVATHGFYLRDTCASRWRPRGVSSRASALIPPPLTADSPLLASGIVFAGSNDRSRRDVTGNDGILTAEEIASLDLGSVSWVVLSACETALGETAAREGVLGLRRAFVVAGAGTLVSSLWQVNDRATMVFMNHLYDYRFSRGESTPEAMRDAELWLLRRKRAGGGSTLPADWGAFLAVDSWGVRARPAAH